MPVLILVAPVPIQLPACGPGEQSRTAQGFGNLHPRRRPGRGSWLQISIALAVALTWGVNHGTKDLPLCLSSLYIRLSNKKNNNNKNKSLKKIYLKKKTGQNFKGKRPEEEVRINPIQTAGMQASAAAHNAPALTPRTDCTVLHTAPRPSHLEQIAQCCCCTQCLGPHT